MQTYQLPSGASKSRGTGDEEGSERSSYGIDMMKAAKEDTKYDSIRKEKVISTQDEEK